MHVHAEFIPSTATYPAALTAASRRRASFSWTGKILFYPPSFHLHARNASSSRVATLVKQCPIMVASAVRLTLMARPSKLERTGKQGSSGFRKSRCPMRARIGASWCRLPQWRTWIRDLSVCSRNIAPEYRSLSCDSVRDSATYKHNVFT